MDYKGDKFLSNWIYFWYFLYILKFIKYSPKLFISIGIIENIGLALFLFNRSKNIEKLITYVVTNVIIKLILYYSIRNTVVSSESVILTVLVVIIYFTYVFSNDHTFFTVLEKQYKLLYE